MSVCHSSSSVLCAFASGASWITGDAGAVPEDAAFSEVVGGALEGGGEGAVLKPVGER